jgi:hypothetical protein
VIARLPATPCPVHPGMWSKAERGRPSKLSRADDPLGGPDLIVAGAALLAQKSAKGEKQAGRPSNAEVSRRRCGASHALRLQQYAPKSH